MCIVCVELIKQNMTVYEAERNLGELGRTERDRKLAKHYKDLHDALYVMDIDKVNEIFEEDGVRYYETP